MSDGLLDFDLKGGGFDEPVVLGGIGQEFLGFGCDETFLSIVASYD